MTTLVGCAQCGSTLREAMENEHKHISEAPEEALASLMRTAHAARANAYCPYSDFRVGAAVLCHDGTVFVGTNVENASFGLTVCAERVAIMNAASRGYRKFKAIAMCCDMKHNFKGPCGACRQVIAEFGLDVPIYTVRPDETWQQMDLRTIFPMAFTPESLAAERDMTT